MSLLFATEGPDEISATPAHRLFFALYPPLETAAELHRLGGSLRRRHRLTGLAAPPELLHISLNSLGSHERPPKALIAAAIDAVSAMPVAPFLVALDRVGTWGRGAGARPLVLWADDGLIGAQGLHAKIHAALVAAGIARGPEPPIAPHLTLLRDQTVAAPEFIDPVRWMVRELLLLDSPRGAGRHEVLGRWPLVG